jgi:hypothetical protein
MLMKNVFCLSLATASAMLTGWTTLRADEAPTLQIPAVGEPEVTQGAQVAEETAILIVPAAKLPVDTAPQSIPLIPDINSDRLPTIVDRDAYSRIYRSIPFNRAEYNANPSYRHDSTMEMLTGNPRHQTIVKHTTTRPRPVTAPVVPPVVPYRYNNPAYGLNYYFYFPYWNFRGIY